MPATTFTLAGDTMYVHRTNSIEALNSLANGGRLMSALEGVQHSSYSFDGVEARKLFEEELFGGHPVFAQMAHSAEVEESGYGNIRISINPDKVVATGMFGDSLRAWDTYRYYSKHECWKAVNKQATKKVKARIVASPYKGDPNTPTVNARFCSWEIQIHSPITLDCVTAVDMGNNEIPFDTYNSLVKAGVKVTNFWLEGCGPDSFKKRCKAKEDAARSLRFELKMLKSWLESSPTWDVTYNGVWSLWHNGRLVYCDSDYYHVQSIVRTFFILDEEANPRFKVAQQIAKL